MATMYFYAQSGSSTDWQLVATYPTGTVTLSGQPADGDTIAFGNMTYEFDSDSLVSEGRIQVIIGATVAETAANLAASVGASFYYTISGASGTYTATSSGGVVSITATTPGEAGNSEITASGSNISVAGVSGGANGNWRLTSFGDPSGTLPTSSDSVVMESECSTNTGSEPTVVDLTTNHALGIDITVTGLATFDGNGSNGGTLTGNAVFWGVGTVNTGNITGDVTFNDGSVHNFGTITGNVTFNGYSANYSNIFGNVTFSGSSVHSTIITGNATFNDYSYSYGGGVTGNATFNDYSYVTFGGSITGNATFNDYSYADNAIVTGDATFSVTAAALQLEDYSAFIGGSVVITYEKGINGSSILGVV